MSELVRSNKIILEKLDDIGKKMENLVEEKVKILFEDKVKKVLDEKVNCMQEKIEEVNVNLTHYIVKHIYHTIDLFKIMFNIIPSTDQTNSIIQSLSNQKIINMKLETLSSYVDRYHE